MHETHKPVPLPMMLSDHLECRWCRVCECHDVSGRLEKICVSNPHVRVKRALKLQEELLKGKNAD